LKAHEDLVAAPAELHRPWIGQSRRMIADASSGRRDTLSQWSLLVIGTKRLNAYLNKYKIELDPQLEALIGRPWISSTNFCVMITRTGLLHVKQ